MLDTIFATKGEMTQVWTKQGKRIPVTRCIVDNNVILGQQKCVITDHANSSFTQKPALILEVGYGKKKLKNTSKPLRTIIEKSGFSFGVRQIRGIRLPIDENQAEGDESSIFKIGEIIDVDQVLSVGDVVKVQGTSKGHGFSGVVKRYGMKGGPKTRGQSDRHRAVGSIGSQTPGKVWKGKRMPGHYGVETTTVSSLVVVHLDLENKEVWLSGPIPGHLNSTVQITKMGTSKKFELDEVASGIEPQKEIVTESSEKSQNIDSAQKEEDKITEKKEQKLQEEPSEKKEEEETKTDK